MTSSTEGASRIVTLAVAGAVLVQCSAPPPPPPPPPSVTRLSPSVARPSPSTTVRAPATIQPVTAADLGPSWRPGCPVDPRQLREVSVDYIGFDGKTHQGALVVHEDLAEEVIAIFKELLQLRYPIEKIRTVNN